MLTEVLEGAWTLIWRRRDTWWIVLWTTVLSVGAGAVVGVLMAPLVPGVPSGTILGGVPDGMPGSVFQSNFFTTVTLPRGGLPAILPALMPGVLVVLLAFVLVAIPFIAAGVYGVLARAMREEGRLSPYAFWQEGLRNWGRGYGLALMGLVVMGAAFVAASLLFLVLHLLGTLGVVIAIIGIVAIFLFAVLWLYWATAHLFMARWPWGKSLGAGMMDAWRFKWASLGTVIVLALLTGVLHAAVTPLDQVAVVGTVVALVVGGWLTLFSGAAQLGFHVYGERPRP